MATFVSFSVKDDDIPESEEIYYLDLAVFDPNVNIGSRNRLRVTIRASDDANGVFKLDQVTIFIYN